MTEFRSLRGIDVPVVRPDADGNIRCPFCEKTHRHANINGHRIPNCKDQWKHEIVLDGKTCYKWHGYFIETKNKQS